MTVVKSIGTATGSTGPGTVTTVGTTSVVGVSTTFTSTFTVPDVISISGTLYDITAITNDTHLTTSQTQGTHTNVSYLVGLRNFSTLATMATWVNAQNVGTGGLNDNVSLQCYNDSEFSVAAMVALGGWTDTGGTGHSVTVTTGTGQSFRDNASAQTNALRYNQANGVGIKDTAGYGAAFNVTGTFVIFSGLQFNSVAASGSDGCLRLSTSSTVTINDCILYGQSKGSADGLIYSSTSGAQTVILQNTAVVVATNTGAAVNFLGGGSATFTFYENTIVGTSGTATIGITVSNTISTITAANNVVLGFTTDYIGTCTTSANNATDKGTFGGTGWGTSGVTSVTSAAFQSVTNGSEDLRLKSGSVLINAGTTAGPNTDIVGTSRPQGTAYCIGCWEYIPSASPIIFIDQLSPHGRLLTSNRWSAATIKEDDGIEAVFVPPPPAPSTFAFDQPSFVRRRPSRIVETSEWPERPLINFVAFGYDPPPTVSRRNYRQPMPGEDGTEAPFIGPPAPFTAFAFDHSALSVRQRRRLPTTGDDGDEAPYIAPIAPAITFAFDQPMPVGRRRQAMPVVPDAPLLPLAVWVNFGWVPVTHDLPHVRRERAAATARGDDGIQDILRRWLNAGWEVAPVQPPHPRSLHRSAIQAIGDAGIQAVQVQFLPYGWEVQVVQPPAFPAPRARRGSAILTYEVFSGLQATPPPIIAIIRLIGSEVVPSLRGQDAQAGLEGSQVPLGLRGEIDQ